MNQQARIAGRPWLRVFVLAAAVAAAPLPAVAGDSHSPAQRGPGIKASAAKAVAAETAKPAAGARMAQSQDPPRTDLGSSNFFKTPAGIITLVAVGVGVGYALYSTSNDRVKSPAR